MKAEKHTTIYRKDYTVSAFLIENVFLTFQLHTEYTVVRCRTEISRNPASQENPESLVLNGENLELVTVDYNGRQLSSGEYKLSASTLEITEVADSFILEIVTKIFPDNNFSLEGLYRSSGNYCTQCEAEGFRKITYYLDRPDVLAKFTTRVEGERQSCPVLLANGNLIEEGELPGNRHYAVWEDPFPKPSYLFALVAGDLRFIEDNYTTSSGRNICLRIYVEERNITKCDHAMRSLKRAMKWDEDIFGLEYDLDIFMIVAVDDFNMGAMENKGLNIFNSKYILASPETATDSDYLGIEGVVAHEYFHNWTGNRVTCRDWFQLSLKEGLTVFRDQEFSADMNSRAVQRIDDVRILRNNQFREDSGPMAHPVRPDSYVEINNFYTVTVYNKGAEVIRMMHTLLGEEGFRKGMDLYFQRHDGQAVTCDDFVAAMQDANHYDLEQFSLWYSQAGTPRLHVDTSYQQEEGVFSITLQQECDPTPGQQEKLPFHMPIAVGLLDEHGQDIPINGDDTLVLELCERKETYTFAGISSRPTLSFLRNFSSPVNVQPFQSEEEMAYLMAHDSDHYNRWDAASRLAEKIILDTVASLQQGQQPCLDPDYSTAVAKSIQTGVEDAALLSLTLQLPAETYLAGKMQVIDPENLHKAREFVKQELSSLLFEEFLRLYRTHRGSEQYEISATAIGTRSLKNTALDYLAATAPEAVEAVDLCLLQYELNANMTDTLAALNCIANTEIDVRDDLLSDFYSRWKDDPLVMDKWLIIQATSKIPGTLDRVRELMGDPVFSLKNPNKVRSLIGAFCAGNHFRFHDSSGNGYRFLADMVVELNEINPQIAARLLSSFTTWKRYDSERQILMRDQLERIASLPSLSCDVYEIVKKTL